MKKRNTETQVTETQVTETQATETQATETQATETQVAELVAGPSEKLVGLTETINMLLTVQKRSDYAIAFTLNLIKKHHKEEIKNLGYKNVEEYAESQFSFAKSTYHSYTKVAERFIKPATETRKCLTGDPYECFNVSTIVGAKSFTVLKDIDGYEFSISQMLELLALTDEEIQEHLEEFSSTNTTKSIREKVKAIKTAISTTATETNESQNGCQDESQNGCQDESQNGCQDESQNGCQDESQNEPMTDNKRILAILAIANDLENETFRNSLVELLNSFING